jgi:hypothetical protein
MTEEGFGTVTAKSPVQQLFSDFDPPAGAAGFPIETAQHANGRNRTYVLCVIFVLMSCVCEYIIQICTYKKIVCVSASVY